MNKGSSHLAVADSGSVPGRDWEALGKELTASARAARRENRRLGYVTPATMQRVQASLAMSDAALSIDDIKAKATGAAS